MGAFIKSWSASGGNYCDLYGDYFVIGRNNGPWDDNAGQCSNDEFLAGTYQDLVLSTFGQNVLNEIIMLIKGSGENPAVIEERTKAFQIAALWQQIPVNTYLKTIYEDHDERGYDYYCKEEGFFIYLPQHGLEITDDGMAYLTEKNKVAFMSFSCSAAICMDGYFYLAGGELSILDKDANFLIDSFSSFKKFKRNEQIQLPFEHLKSLELGDRFRVTDIYRRAKNIVCFYDNYFFTDSDEQIKKVAGQKGLLEITPLGIKSRLVLE
jgi:hypothetical protein